MGYDLTASLVRSYHALAILNEKPNLAWDEQHRESGSGSRPRRAAIAVPAPGVRPVASPLR